MTEIVDIEIGTTPKIITKEANHGMTMKQTNPLAGRDHMIETIYTVETNHGIAMIQIDPITEMICIAEIGHMTEINHTIEIDHTEIEIGHRVEIDHKTTTKMITERTIEMITTK